MTLEPVMRSYMERELEAEVRKLKDQLAQTQDELQGERWDNDCKDAEIAWLRAALEKDRTAMTEPLTTGQEIVAWWETSPAASEPADLADKIDGELERLRAALREIADMNVDDHGYQMYFMANVAKEALGK
jgi:hypothetical protein